MICQIFDPQSILKLSTIEYSTEDPNLFLPAIQLLKDKRLADTRLEISSEDVKAYTDESYKAQIINLWKTVNEMLLQSANMIQQIPEMAGICKVSIMEVVRGFRVGRTVENKLEQAIDSAIKAYMENKANAEPSVEDKKLELENKKLDLEAKKVGTQLIMQNEKDNTQNSLEAQRVSTEIERLKAQTAKIVSDREVQEEQLNLAHRKEDRKDRELDSEIALAWYGAHHPEATVDTNLGAIGD